ncbi:ankyrin repeat-containing domain protein [Baffinella frigidus]|nr:ankyrin repeat-containing domain protein [Cryptophyta sp. CCMP2293]
MQQQVVVPRYALRGYVQGYPLQYPQPPQGNMRPVFVPSHWTLMPTSTARAVHQPAMVGTAFLPGTRATAGRFAPEQQQPWGMFVVQPRGVPQAQGAAYGGPGERTNVEETPVPDPALWMAVTLGRLEEVRQLVADGADIDESGGPDKTTPLHEAAGRGYEEVTRLLLEHQADVSAKATDGATALLYAVVQGYESVSKLLIEHHSDVSSYANGGGTALHYAAFQGLETVAWLLLEHGADVFARNNEGEPVLQWAAHCDHETVVRLLICYQADVSAKDNTAVTPLHEAAHRGHETVVRLLLDKGADEQSKTKVRGKTPEDAATAQGHLKVAGMLNAEGVRRAQCMAFAMGQHARLGAGTRVEELDAGVARMVLEQV